jgi:hypothetical protein
MKTLDWSVETLGLDYNSTGLCNHLFKPEQRAKHEQLINFSQTPPPPVFRTIGRDFWQRFPAFFDNTETSAEERGPEQFATLFD